ncbi:MAG: ribosome maturation factor RimP [Alphaproteobacteria bacterium]|nr:ribosome maturation factor RimP [Alphaproteobacteria bacterium]
MKVLEIEKLIEPTIAGLGYRLVQVRLMGGGRPVLQVMAERVDECGMTVDDCATISRTISTVLETEDPIESGYVLEVSSPGIDRPLVRLDDFVRFSGHVAKVETALPVEGRRRHKGTIAAVEGSRIKLSTEQGTIELDFSDVTAAKLVLADEILRGAAVGRH